MGNHFVDSPEDYVHSRDLNVLKNYVKDAAFYLHKQTGRPIEECEDFVRSQVEDAENPAITDPEVLSLTKHTPGNRDKETLKFSEYLRDVIVNNRLLSPTMAVYYNPEQKESLTAGFIQDNIKKRDKPKKEMLEAKERGDEETALFKKNEQTSLKRSNNSLSGAQGSTSTILYNKTAHSTLTSTCRTATSYGNANNEKFLFGNRHYWSPEIVKANIVSICRNVDLPLIEETMARHGIRPPTVAETMECIRYSTDLYWKKEEELQAIEQFVSTLTDLERSAFVYVGDLHHLAKYNRQVVYQFLDRLSTKAEEGVENPEEHIKAMDEDMGAFVYLLCAQELGGETVAEVKVNRPEDYALIGATAKKIMETLDDYQDLIRSLWKANTLPASVAHIRSSIRRGVITSDTDSTIFTVQDWTQWFTGGLDFSEKSKSVAYAVVYLATQTITHLLAKISANMGVGPERVHDLTMKNEFAFPIFVLTSMAKHYFAYISAQEGKVFQEYDKEIKGVYLKDSNVPPHIMKRFHETLKEVMDTIIEGKKVSLKGLFQQVADIESEVARSIRSGDPFYLTGGQVKDPNSYANPDQSPYQQYLLWEEVFAHKYGHAPAPPYPAVKVSLETKTRRALDGWLSEIADEKISGRMRVWLEKNKKQAIGSLLLPREVVTVTGIPEEIVQGMNIRKLIYGTVKPYYILLESLGIYMINDNLTRLISDSWEPSESVS